MSQPKKVYTVESLVLLDGTVVEVKPLPIKRLRAAQRAIQDALAGTELTDDDGNVLLDKDGEPQREVSDDALMDAFLDVTEMVMKNQEKCEKFLEPDNGRELLEDSVDQETLYEIVRVSTGYDFLAMQKRMQAIMEKEMSL